VDTAAGGARTGKKTEKHRTEVTEATEGGLEERLLVDPAAGGRGAREKALRRAVGFCPGGIAR
jgi:hypothetical protein